MECASGLWHDAAMIRLSSRIQKIKPSATLTITAKAAELRAEGRDIISLSVGEPDFDTPKLACDAAIAAIREGFTRYTAVPGIPELRRAIADKFRRDNGLDYAPEEVLVSTGGKQCIYNLLQAMLDAGDEVVIPAPYWVSYADIAVLAGGVPKFIETSESTGFRTTPEQLALLLASADDKHPRGLANGSDQVGRNFMMHNNAHIVAIDSRRRTITPAEAID